MSEKAPTILGDALRDLADVCDLNPDWTAIGCLFSLDGARLNFHAVDGGFPIHVARAILAAALADETADPDEHRNPFHVGGSSEIEAD